MKFLEKKTTQFLIILAVLGIAMVFSFYNRDKLISYKENGYVVEGVIIDHYTIGLEASYNIKFSYEVNEKKYSNSFNTVKRYTDCYRTRKCIGEKVKVYYNPKNPKESLLDF